MSEKEVNDFINNMNEEEMNDFIFFALKEMTKKVDRVKQYMDIEDKRIKKELHQFGNKQRNEYSGILLGKSGMIDNIRRIINE